VRCFVGERYGRDEGQTATCLNGRWKERRSCTWRYIVLYMPKLSIIMTGSCNSWCIIGPVRRVSQNKALAMV